MIDARFGPTPRTRVMFGPGGVTYVYLCYGVHQMFNIVADRDGQAGAVLVRAIAPVAGRRKLRFAVAGHPAVSGRRR